MIDFRAVDRIAAAATASTDHGPDDGRPRPAGVGMVPATGAVARADRAAAVKELGRAVGRLSAAVFAAFEGVPWFSSLPANSRSWVRLVAGREIVVMTENLPSLRPPGLRNIFSGAPAEIARQITLNRTVELIHLSVDVVLDVVGEVVGGPSAALLRPDLERYGREVAFSAAAVYAKAAESRGQSATRRQEMLVSALVEGDSEQIAARASELISLTAPVRVIGLVPAPGFGPAVVEAVRRVASRHGLTACAGPHGQFVIVALLMTGSGPSSAPPGTAATGRSAATLFADLVGSGIAGAGIAGAGVEGAGVAGAGVEGAAVGATGVLSNVAGSLVDAGPAAAAVLSGLRALPAWLGPVGLIGVDDLLAERALCGDASAARQLVADCFDPLVSAGRGLVETVDALLRYDGSPAAAAASIPVHVNTLRYRLDRIVALTGRDPRRGRDAFVLRVAFTLARTTPVPSP